MSERASVLIVGAGLAGLGSAMFLARRGVDVLLVERRSGTSPFPRAVGQNQRTMELLGFAGVAGDVPTTEHGEFRVRVAATLPGPTFHEVISETDTGLGALSPALPGTAGQDEMEPLLRRRAEEFGATLRFDTELVSFSQDNDGVTAVISGPDGRSEVRADYLVAADGARSGVREALGIERHGAGKLGQNVSIVFDADLSDVVEPAPPTLHVLHNPDANGVFITIDGDRHLFSVNAEKLDDDQCVELIRLITERPSLAPRIVAVMPWEMAAEVADRLRVGRVLLAGDAAKVTPPSGGFGGNTAIGDAYDLAWKLAAVLDSTAGPGLLDSYDAERRPIAERVVAEALRLAANRGVTEEVSEAQRAVELTLGFRYRSWAVVAEDDDPLDAEDPYRPSGRPGFRAPHVELDGKSIVDLFGDGFVLLTGKDGLCWTDTGLPTHVIDSDEFLARYGIGPSGASLVRPDGVVAWRIVDAPSDPAQALLDVLTSVLAR
ncbi:FAD-dependent oxidoreductase [Kutzneria buriramensis]|uniref:Aklavinone 12-hydroxylase n=2 Tax=Kutzneria buriramensis TaxID=1045776 RepID=A0A3E0I7A7_9PSEU|nr:FAD-dependent oxidoreductase [Kutzneria buriramensis]REH54035.1 aklavinone 12-hydroxylase [Kutzneria buriramensis]